MANIVSGDFSLSCIEYTVVFNNVGFVGSGGGAGHRVGGGGGSCRIQFSSIDDTVGRAKWRILYVVTLVCPL